MLIIELKHLELTVDVFKRRGLSALGSQVNVGRVE